MEDIEKLIKSNDEEFVFTHCEKCFKTDESRAIEIFISKNRKVPLTPSRVMNFLRKYPPRLETRYLEFLIDELHSEDCEYHTLLAMNYIDQVEKLKTNKSVSFGVAIKGSKDGGILGEIRWKLMRLLQKKPIFFDATTVYERLRETNLYEEMIMLNQNLHNHKAVLELIIFKTGNFAAAEQYCIQVAEERRRNFQNENKCITSILDNELNPLFLVLLEICVARVKSAENNANIQKDVWSFVIDILSKHAKQIDPVQVLRFIPDHTPLKILNSFYRRIIQSSHHRLRQTKILMNLHNQNYLKTNALLARGLSQHVTIRNNTICPVCKRVIGSSSVFTVYPDCTVVHVKCSGRLRNIHPISEIDFNTFPIDLSSRISDDEILKPRKILE